MDVRMIEEWRDEARRALTHEADALQEQLYQRQCYMQALDATEDLVNEVKELTDKVERQQQTIDELNEQVEQRDAEIAEKDAALAEKDAEIADLRGQLQDMRVRQLVAEPMPQPMEIHNHFESGSSSQVFNDKVNGKFIRKQKDENKKKKRWKKIVRKML
jgi:predicted RNase H-like nuclease (RuvC/YqgF family)